MHISIISKLLTDTVLSIAKEDYYMQNSDFRNMILSLTIFYKFSNIVLCTYKNSANANLLLKN